MPKKLTRWPPPNVALRNAIFQTGWSQQHVALLARITPAKLSHAIYRRRSLFPDERARLAKVLYVTEHELFADEPVPLPICPPPPEREL